MQSYNWIAYFICRACSIKFPVLNDAKEGVCCPTCGGKDLVEDEIRLRT